MTEEQKTTEDAVVAEAQAPEQPAAQASAETTDTVESKATEDKKPSDSRDRRGGYQGRGGQGGDRRRGGRRPQRREKPEFEQKIISLRRVTRVMAGGRRFSFSCAMVIGDKKGRVGFGIGKAGDTALAIDKAVRMAKRDMVTVKRTADTNSIPHDSQAKFKASEVLLRPVSGKGLAAGGAVRVVLEMAGVNEVGGKLLSRSKNNINNAKATLLALKPFTVK